MFWLKVVLYKSDIVQSDDEDVEIRKPSRKLLKKNRLIHDIHSSLNEECYNDIHFINGKGQWQTLTGYLGPNTNKNTNTITWTIDFPTQTRRRACDIINIGDSTGTLLGAARNIDIIEDAFNLLCDEQMLDLLVRETNLLLRENCKLWKVLKNIYSKVQNILTW